MFGSLAAAPLLRTIGRTTIAVGAVLTAGDDRCALTRAFRNWWAASAGPCRVIEQGFTRIQDSIRLHRLASRVR